MGKIAYQQWIFFVKTFGFNNPEIFVQARYVITYVGISA